MFVTQVTSVFLLGVFILSKKRKGGKRRMIPTEIQEYCDDIQLQIGQRIQEKRLEKKLAAADVAAYLNIKSNQLSRIENGRANCTVPQMFVLAQLLECSVDYLMFGKQQQSGFNEAQQEAINSMLLAFGAN